MARGKFIAFEGIDGSGKSTQIKALKKHLESRGMKCYVTREPSDSPMGALAHQCMTGRVITDDETIALLVAADRVDHLHNPVNGLLRKLEEGFVVITDRYYLSSYAYQGAHLPLDWVKEINRRSAETLRPDLHIYIDIDPDKSFARVSRREDRERYEELENLKRVREQYFAVIERLKAEENIAVVKSEEDPAVTAEHIRAVADRIFE